MIQQALHRQPSTAAQYLQQMYAAQQQHLMLQTAALQQQHLSTAQLQSLAAVQQVGWHAEQCYSRRLNSMATILHHLMCFSLSSPMSLILFQASIAAGRQSSTQNGTSSTQSGSSQTTVSLHRATHINCLCKADHSCKGVFQIVTDILYLYMSLQYYVCAIILSLFFLSD